MGRADFLESRLGSRILCGDRKVSVRALGDGWDGIRVVSLAPRCMQRGEFGDFGGILRGEIVVLANVVGGAIEASLGFPGALHELPVAVEHGVVLLVFPVEGAGARERLAAEQREE